MNYKEEYNKTVESIKRIYEQSDSFGKELMEKEFPKLHGLSETEIIENLYRLLCAEVSIGTFEKYGLTDDAVFSWLKKQGEQKPAEWSEENKRILARLIYVFNSYKNSDYRIDRDKWEGLEINSILHFLKSLKPQPQQKLSEVKSETKNKCPNYSEGYGCSISPLKKCDTCSNYKLYNHWKPNKEQLDTLKYACGGNFVNLRILESLYNDLKNL